MTRDQLLNIRLGQQGLYQWDRNLPVTRVDEPQVVLKGPRKGRLFRFVEVSSLDDGSAKISFVVWEA